MSPADWLRRGHPEGLPTLFIDRSLGRNKVPTLLREAGLELVTLAEQYGIPQDEEVDDVTWLADTAARGWVALGKDPEQEERGQQARQPGITHGCPAVRCAVLQPDAIPVWLNKPVRALDHDRPVELIARGEYRRVAELLAELETPTF